MVELLSWDFNAEDDLKSGGEVGLSHGCRQKHQMSRWERSLQSPEDKITDLNLSRPLLREPQHILLQRRVRIAYLELIEFADLAICESGPLTEGQMVVQSVVAIGQAGCLQVG